MDIYRGAERLMGMDDAVWLRHANPWSGWSRMTVLPLFALAVWSRVWLGWLAVIPVAAVVFWAWWNPRAFPPPARFDHWMSKGVLGERVYLTHRDRLAAHHPRAAIALTWASLPGAAILIWGLIVLWWEGVVFGTLLSMVPKIWFVDRMVWILEDWQRQGGTVPDLPQGVDNV